MTYPWIPLSVFELEDAGLVEDKVMDTAVWFALLGPSCRQHFLECLSILHSL